MGARNRCRVLHPAPPSFKLDGARIVMLMLLRCNAFLDSTLASHVRNAHCKIADRCGVHDHRPKISGGVAVAVSQCKSNIPSFVGIAIAASILPPAVNCGMCLATLMLGERLVVSSRGGFLEREHDFSIRLAARQTMAIDIHHAPPACGQHEGRCEPCIRHDLPQFRQSAPLSVTSNQCQLEENFSRHMYEELVWGSATLLWVNVMLIHSAAFVTFKMISPLQQFRYEEAQSTDLGITPFSIEQRSLWREQLKVCSWES